MIRLWCYGDTMVDDQTGVNASRVYKYKCGHAGCVKTKDKTSSCLCNLTGHATLYNMR